jgi:hypothetical protein
MKCHCQLAMHQTAETTQMTEMSLSLMNIPNQTRERNMDKFF